MLYVTIIKIIRSLFGWSTSRTYTHTYTRARSYAIHHVHVYCIYIQYQILGVLNTKRVVFGKLKPSAYTHTLIFFSFFLFVYQPTYFLLLCISIYLLHHDIIVVIILIIYRYLLLLHVLLHTNNWTSNNRLLFQWNSVFLNPIGIESYLVMLLCLSAIIDIYYPHYINCIFHRRYFSMLWKIRCICTGEYRIRINMYITKVLYIDGHHESIQNVAISGSISQFQACLQQQQQQ